MSAPLLRELATLLETSAKRWGWPCVVSRPAPDRISIAACDDELDIARAPDGMPFRWVVTIGQRRRTAASVSGVLGIVRRHFDPHYQSRSIIIAARNEAHA